MKKNIHAYTESGFDPAYISVNTEDNGSHTIVVRGNGVGAGTGEVTMTKERLLELADDIKNEFSDK